MIAAAVYLLCAVTSIICMVLLVIQFLRTRSRLVFWSAACFVGLAINNAMLFVDLVLLPATTDLQVPRLIASGLGMSVLLFGFIWEGEQ